MDYTTLSSSLVSPEEGYCFDVASLYAEFEQIADGRQARGRRYALPVILRVIALAKLAGANTLQAIADWARFRAETLATALGLKHKRMPHATTYRRAVQKVISLEQLEQVSGGYLQRKSAPSKKGEEPSEATRPEIKVLNMDGKTLRGTIAAGQRQGEHLPGLARAMGGGAGEDRRRPEPSAVGGGQWAESCFRPFAGAVPRVVFWHSQHATS